MEFISSSVSFIVSTFCIALVHIASWSCQLWVHESWRKRAIARDEKIAARQTASVGQDDVKGTPVLTRFKVAGNIYVAGVGVMPFSALSDTARLRHAPEGSSGARLLLMTWSRGCL
eukprot:GEMP01046423.1.p1 GENE.GEMP01046423.1~~GEMP01046423.1.p1  ORF type:complete len:116 (+),score=27.71 GEMP01046423.1:112-459(+)